MSLLCCREMHQHILHNLHLCISDFLLHFSLILSSVDIQVVFESWDLRIKNSSSLWTLNFNKQTSLNLDRWRELIGAENHIPPHLVVWCSLLLRAMQKYDHTHTHQDSQPTRRVYFNTLTSNGSSSLKPLIMPRKGNLNPVVHSFIVWHHPFLKWH